MWTNIVLSVLIVLVFVLGSFVIGAIFAIAFTFRICQVASERGLLDPDESFCKENKTKDCPNKVEP